jgi:hypothetical protein
MTTGRPAEPGARTGCTILGLLRVVVVGAALVWLASSIGGAIDRRLRTETIDGFGAAGPIHLAPDGRIVLARAGSTSTAADGRIEAFDPATWARTIVLDDLVDPIAADMAPDGTVCAIRRSTGGGDAVPLRCSSGLKVDIDYHAPAPLKDRPDLRGPLLTDVVSDGTTGWIVADFGGAAILHVDEHGEVAVIATIHQYETLSARPAGLARDGSELFLAIGRGGYARLATTDRDVRIDSGIWVGGGSAIAVFARPVVPLVLVAEDRGGRVTYPVFPDAERPSLVEELTNPRGVVVLPDGRIAVADGSRLVIVRPSRQLP